MTESVAPNIHAPTEQVTVQVDPDTCIVHIEVVTVGTAGITGPDGFVTLYDDYVAQGGTLTYQQFRTSFFNVPAIENAVITTNLDW